MSSTSAAQPGLRSAARICATWAGLVLGGVLSLAPAVLLMTTCFVRMSVVLSLVRRHGGLAKSDIILGDRFGTSAAGYIIDIAEQAFTRLGFSVTRNRPYAGGYVLERHSAPAQGLHAVQLEIDRSRYLDSRLVEPGPGFAGMVELLTGLVQRLAQSVASLGEAGGPAWSQAAE